MRIKYFGGIIAVAIFVQFLVATVSAVDVHIDDVRGFTGILATDYTTRTTTAHTIPGGATTVSSDEAGGDSLNFRTGIEYMTGRLGSFGGLVYGGAICDSEAHYNEGSSRVDLSGPMIDAIGGYAFAPLNTWHFEITAVVGGGLEFVSIFSEAQPTVRARSRVLEYGLRTATFWTFNQRWQIGLELETLASRSHPRYSFTDYDGHQIAVTEKRASLGTGAMVALGVRF